VLRINKYNVIAEGLQGKIHNSGHHEEDQDMMAYINYTLITEGNLKVRQQANTNSKCHNSTEKND